MAIKQLDTAKLLQLCTSARLSGYSAWGRPAWLREVGQQVVRVLLCERNLEAPGVRRCFAAVLTERVASGVFTLDVSEQELRSLTDLSEQSSGEVIEALIVRLPTVPVESA